jgi:hypothetical protein
MNWEWFMNRGYVHYLSRGLGCLALFISLSAYAYQDGLRPFTSDGCSLFPDRALIGKKDWCHCCLAHDLAYWQGGTKEQRLQADVDLQICVKKEMKDSVLANVMLIGVRMGGSPYFATPYRWGYGWSYGRNYQALNEEEQAQAEQLKKEYLEKNPCLLCRVETEN